VGRNTAAAIKKRAVSSTDHVIQEDIQRKEKLLVRQKGKKRKLQGMYRQTNYRGGKGRELRIVGSGR